MPGIVQDDFADVAEYLLLTVTRHYIAQQYSSTSSWVRQPMPMSRIIPAVVETIAVLVVAALGLAGSVGAQVYPSGPITMIVPFAAGGPTDAVARVMSDVMGRSLARTSSSRMSPARPAALASAGSRAPPPTATRSCSAFGARMSSTARSTIYLMIIEGLRADRAIAQQSNACCQQQCSSGQKSEGSHHLDDGKSDPSAGRHRRRRFGHACRRRLLREAYRGAASVRAV